MTMDEMITRTIAQKKMAAMIMEDTAEEVEAVRARQAAAEAEAAAAVGGAGADGGQANGEMDVSEDEDEEQRDRKRREEEERQRELERARAIAASSVDASGPIKIRTDYVPKREQYIPLDFFSFSNISFALPSRSEGFEGHDNLFRLWATNSRGRIARAHAY